MNIGYFKDVNGHKVLINLDSFCDLTMAPTEDGRTLTTISTNKNSYKTYDDITKPLRNIADNSLGYYINLASK